MKLVSSERFRLEQRRYELRFCCEDCALFAPDAAECTLGFPTEEHRKSRYDDERADIVFCKSFELA